MNRPLQQFSSELLVWLFWNTKYDLPGVDSLFEQIHAEMNARGEGEKVAV
jgi:hypothetical protein